MRTYTLIPKAITTIDRDMMMRCLLKGERREDVHMKIQQKAEAAQDRWKRACDMKSPTRLYNILAGIMRETVQEFFENSTGAENPRLKELRQQRNELLKQRRSILTNSTQKIVEYSDLECPNVHRTMPEATIFESSGGQGVSRDTQTSPERCDGGQGVSSDAILREKM